MLFKRLMILASMKLAHALPKISTDSGAVELRNQQLDARAALVLQDCKPAESASITEALLLCGETANRAAAHAISGNNTQFARYFNTTDPQTRQKVSKRLAAVAKECLGETMMTTHFCHSSLLECPPRLIAAANNDGIFIRCPSYWKKPLRTKECHGMDHVHVTIHELMHVDKLFGENAVDGVEDGVETYGWPDVSRLNAAKAVRNADNYAYHANSLRFGKDC